MPAVLNIRDFKFFPPNAKYIGRGSPYGNPFRIGLHGTRENCIERFKCEVLPTLDVSDLAGYDLMCHCYPLACHGDPILEKANPNMKKLAKAKVIEPKRQKGPKPIAVKRVGKSKLAVAAKELKSKLKGKGSYAIIEDDFLPTKPAVKKVLPVAMHVVFDTETTGLVTNRSIKLSRQPEIIEFYACLVDLSSGKVAKDIHHIIQPTVEWPMTDYTIKATKTKLGNDLLADKPKFAAVADSIKAFLEAAPSVIAHNVSFDKDMVEIEFERLGQTITWPKRCICTVEQTLHMKGHRLNQTKLHELLFKEAFDGAHRAPQDVAALTRIACELYRRGLI